MPRIKRLIVLLAVMLAVPSISSPPILAQAEDLESYGDEYWPADFGRVTYQENGLTIHRGTVDPGLPPLEEATINSPVFPGDTALTGVDQRAEIQLAGGTLVRVDRATEVTFLSLPDPYAEFSDSSVLQVAEGAIRVTTSLQSGEEFRIDTPASSVYLLGDGDFRVEVTSSGRTEVVSRRGVAEVVGNGGSSLVHGGTRTEVFPASLPDEPWAFNTFVTDSFDRWADERDAVYRVWDRYPDTAEYAEETVQELPAEVRPYYHELEHYGDWTYADDYGYVWYPSRTPAGWSPYHDGYWSHGPRGYFWVSHEPWGWAPYHYGSWNWVSGFGWCWAPGRAFSGAWVAWSWGSTHIGWAPLDYWGRPAYSSVVHFGYYDPGVWTFVDYVHVERRDYQRHAVRLGGVGNIQDATVVTRAPSIPPRLFAGSAERRHAARRMAQEDRAARIRRVDLDSPPPTSMRDVERRVRARGAAGRGARPSAARSATGSSSGPRSSTDSRRTARPGGASDRGFPGYPRRVTADRGTRRQAPRRDTGRSAPARDSTRRTRDPSATPRRTTLPHNSPRGAKRADTEQRVRDLYRRMANPRSPQSPGTTPQRRVRTEHRTGAGPRENPTPRSQRGSPPSRQRQSAPRSGSSGTRKREGSRTPSRGGSRGSRSPSASSRSTNRPGASPPASRPAPPASRARPNGSGASPGRSQTRKSNGRSAKGGKKR